MKLFPIICTTGFTLSAIAILSACGNRTTMEACNIIEIEDAEVEVDIGDVDVERGEVEMVCGDKILDVTWGQFRRRLRIDPGRYKNNLTAFKRQVSCVRDERSRRKEVLCQVPGSNNFVALNFSYDD
ncbi:hypothetical protein [Calothrix sp. CCY 0018]|uniref:hypothetical protein n=1 Tax=Calothrix sp. CCY 0018 TaxID=3103864 RepID=UPI0039C626C9